MCGFGPGRKFRALAAVAAACAGLLEYGAEGAWVPPKNPTRPRDPVDPVVPMAATYLGGPGTEWIGGVDIHTNGVVVVAGTCISGPLTFGRALEAEVVGMDVPMPEGTAVDAKGTPIPINWRHPYRTAFIVRLTPDLQGILSAVRFPWTAGGATDACCDEEGNIYVTGLAGDELRRLGEVKDVSAETNRDTTVFVTKFAPDGRTLLWCRTFTDAGTGPKIRVNSAGDIVAEGGWVYVFNPDGMVKQVAKVEKVGSRARAVNPNDYTYAVGRFWMSGTGREPWRRPWLWVGKGSDKEYLMYDWPGRLAGINSLRLVSDSNIVKLHFNDDGILYVQGWSDGGNTVFQWQPCDIRKPAGFNGLGFSMAGATVGSFCHLVRIDPVDAEVKGYSLWITFYDGKPNSIGVGHMNVAKDKSFIMGGGSAYGLVQTKGPLLHSGMPGGPYVAVMTPEFNGLRLSATMPACGGVEIRKEEYWDSGSAIVNGKCRAVIATAATKDGMTYHTGPHPPPKINAMQSEYGGGAFDGYLLLLDLQPDRRGGPIDKSRRREI